MISNTSSSQEVGKRAFKLRKEKYSVDVEKIREYFPLERVFDGLFSITQSLYGLEYKDVTRAAESRATGSIAQ